VIAVEHAPGTAIAYVRTSHVGVPPNPGDSVGRDEFDRAAREAANDVRRQDKSAG